MKTRRGKGFTLLEVKRAGIVNKAYARTIGIAVDHRRSNHSEESLELNVALLKTYLSKLVLYPRNPQKHAPGDASVEEIKTVTTQAKTSKDVTAYMQNPRRVGADLMKPEPPRVMTAEEKKRQVFMFLRKQNRDMKSVGRHRNNSS